MKSITKNLLSDEQINKLVKVNFGDSCQVGMIQQLKGGMFNSAYLIERLNEKDNIVLKVSVAEGTPVLSYEKATMYTEVEVYKMLTQQTSIPIPKLLAYDFSRKYISSDYFFMTALKGRTMAKVKLTKDNKDSIMRELAGYFAQQHQIKGEYFGYFTQDEKYHFPTWKDAYHHMIDMILKDGKAYGLKLPYERYKKILKEKGQYLEQVKKPILVNYDLHPGNIFLIKQGDKYVIEGIVDFERAYWGDPYADFPAAFLMTDDITKKENFWKAYKELANINHDINKEEKIRLLMYRLYIYTIMWVEVYRYNFPYSMLQKFFSRKVALKCLDTLDEL
ncbi:phosphotransferase family protein [Clostridium oryzae]|uniref:Phosphotransferase enzyme family protein n=1 Tax=Clostridium oryzae TaxID=1450648 RepID=A0A1V4IDY4_9CLOT|nr:phosphotransferase [Clostridium oryzae]OPJ58171.1 phosphotransferase enzyme family protein [Clostridium oryzae]